MTIDVFEQVYLQKDLSIELQNVCKSLFELNKRISPKCLLVSSNYTQLVTKFQAETRIIWSNQLQQLIYNIIIDHCFKAEKLGPGSFFLTLECLLDKMLNFLDEDLTLENVMKSTRQATEKEFRDYLTKVVEDEFLLAVFFQCLELSGVEGKIFVETSPSDTVSVELQNGFNFGVELPFQLNFRKKNVSCLLIDGFIETVAEVHHLLEMFSQSKQSLFLISRGFHADVLQTLRLNFDRQTLSVIPVVARQDLDGLNQLVDLAVACGTDVVSSIKGQLISSIKYDDIVQVPEISCSTNVLTVTNNKALVRAKLHLEHLRKKRAEIQVEQLARTVDSRIQSMCPNSVRVRVPVTQRYSDYPEQFDLLLRLTHSIITRGLFCGHDVVPSDTMLATVKYSHACLELFKSIGAVIV